jgi:dethiobiotin synthetase
MQLAVTATDTGVGKTLVVGWLVQGLRARGRRVHVHKPVACGGWLDGQADDGRTLAGWCGDGQQRASVCPYQFPAPLSPHLAAAAAGSSLHMDQLLANLERVRLGLPGADGDSDLVVEGVGGLLVPLTPERQTVCDFLVASRLPALLVTRPHLGTLNHTALTVAHARRCGIPLLGLVINAHTPVDAQSDRAQVAAELAACTGLPVLAAIDFMPPGCAPPPAQVRRLVEVILALQPACAPQDHQGEPHPASGV